MKSLIVLLLFWPLFINRRSTGVNAHADEQPTVNIDIVKIPYSPEVGDDSFDTVNDAIDGDVKTESERESQSWHGLPDENSVVMDNREVLEDDVTLKRSTSKPLPAADETLLAQKQDFYGFEVDDIRGNHVKLEKYRGMVVLVVNVASECGFTDSHYKSLVRLQSDLSPSGKFTVLAFPCNQFGAQEPGENQQIEKFVSERYHVNFPLFAKIRVVDSDISDAWKFLEETSGKVPNWNFWKYLVDEEGSVVDAWGPWTTVEDITARVKAAVSRISGPQDPELPVLHDGGEL